MHIPPFSSRSSFILVDKSFATNVSRRRADIQRHRIQNKLLVKCNWLYLVLNSCETLGLKKKATEDHYGDACNDQSDSEHSNLDFDLYNYAICRREQPKFRNSNANSFLEDSKTMADRRFFRGLTSQFNLEELGRVYICKYLIADGMVSYKFDRI